MPFSLLIWNGAGHPVGAHKSMRVDLQEVNKVREMVGDGFQPCHKVLQSCHQICPVGSAAELLTPGPALWFQPPAFQSSAFLAVAFKSRREEFNAVHYKTSVITPSRVSI